MTTSVSILLTDILPHKKKLLNKIVKSKLFDNHSVAEVFTILKKSGVSGIELLLPAFTSFDDLADVKKVIDANKINVLSVHQALRFITKTKPEEIAGLFTAAEVFGAKVIVLHMNTVGRQIFSPNYISVLHELEKKHKIKVGFENREKYFASRMSAYGWHEKKFPVLMKKAGFSMTLDTCHLGQAGGDIINFFKTNKSEIVNIQLSDYKAHKLNNSLRPLRYKHLPLGKGSLPVVEFIKFLKISKYKGLLTLEVNCRLDDLIASLNVIKSA